MLSKPHRDDFPVDRARKVAGQPRSASVPTRRGSGAAEALPLPQRITVDREGGRIHVTLTRKYVRHIYLGDDEADYLRGQLARLIAPVTVTRIEDREAGS